MNNITREGILTSRELREEENFEIHMESKVYNSNNL